MFAAMVSVKDSIKNNAVNTSHAVKTIVKSIKTGEELTTEQKIKIGDDLKTLLKNLGYGAVFMLPGGSVFIITFNLIKKIMDKKKLNESNKIKGGKADNLSVKDIADKFKLPVGKIEKEIEIGIKVELEHTDDKVKALEIVKDHLTEFPDYYTRLDKMENDAKKANEKLKENTMKNLIKESLRKRLNENLKTQIEMELERLGVSPEQAQVTFNGKPMGELEEGGIKKIAIACAMVAGMVSCKKPQTKYVYQYSYQTEQSIEHNPNGRITQMSVSDHELSPEELENTKIKLDNAYLDPQSGVPEDEGGNDKLNIGIKLYKIDTQGEW